MGLSRVGPTGPALGRFRPRPLAVGVALAILVVLGIVGWAAIRAVQTQEPEPAQSLESARGRAVTIDGSVCGSAGPSSGSGVALTDDRVVTAAHVVASADRVELVHGGRRIEAEVVALDQRRDLALIEPIEPLVDVPPAPPFSTLDDKQRATVIAAAASGDVEATVLDVTIIEIDEVRGTGRSRRNGYVLDAATKPGDSGSGLYDDQGRLAGLLFAVSTDDPDRSWATASDEIEDFLDESTAPISHRCDPAQSQMVPLADD